VAYLRVGVEGERGRKSSYASHIQLGTAATCARRSVLGGLLPAAVGVAPRSCVDAAPHRSGRKSGHAHDMANGRWLVPSVRGAC